MNTDIEKRPRRGHKDPTADMAIANVMREQKKQTRKPCVFICSPYAGDTGRNAEAARRYLRFAAMSDAIPIAPHLLYPQALNEDDEQEREMGLFFASVWLGKCDEVWVFGECVSEGMSREIAKAKRRNMRIRYFSSRLEEVSEYGDKEDRTHQGSHQF